MQHYHLLRELRIAQLYLGLRIENDSNSPSGEEMWRWLLLLLLLSFAFAGPKVRTPPHLAALRSRKRWQSCHLFCRDDGKAYSDVLWKRFRASVRFFQAVRFEIFFF